MPGSSLASSSGATTSSRAAATSTRQSLEPPRAADPGTTSSTTGGFVTANQPTEGTIRHTRNLSNIVTNRRTPEPAVRVRAVDEGRPAEDRGPGPVVLVAEDVVGRLELVDEPRDAAAAPATVQHARRRPVGAEHVDGLGSKRVIQRRFNVSVPRARVPEKASKLRDRSER